MPESYAGNTFLVSFSAVRNVAVVALAAMGLGACASSGVTPGLSSGSASLAPGAAPVVSSPPPVAAERTVQVSAPARVVAVKMPSVIGAPKGLTGKLKKKLSGKLNQRNVKFVNGSATYSMRGYLAASPEKSGVKVAYIWDVSNKAGKRQHRIIGEEFVPGGKAKNPWNSVNDKVLASIARRTANDLSGWFAKKSGGGVKVATKVPNRRVTANRIPRRATTPSGVSKRNKARTAPKRTVMAMVMPVTGAPGDGRVSLTKAIKQKLYSKGIRLTSRSTDSVYQVRGVVQVGKVKGSTQPIRIDWRVYSPKGKRLGVVTQRNNIPPGSLNGKWGGIATAAAGAAADGIVKLLPKGAMKVAKR